MVMVDVMTRVAMGQTDEVIMRDRMVAGGDDVLQNLEDDQVELYEETALALGFECKLERKDSLDGAEYFSWEITKGDSYWMYEPTRFTKNVVNLLHQKFEEVPGHLTMLMRNWRWNKEVFDLFKSAYVEGHKMQPGLFPIRLIPHLKTLRNEAVGFE
jgi:hypothetical protein